MTSRKGKGHGRGTMDTMDYCLKTIGPYLPHEFTHNVVVVGEGHCGGVESRPPKMSYNVISRELKEVGL